MKNIRSVSKSLAEKEELWFFKFMTSTSQKMDFPPECVARVQRIIGCRVTLRDVDKNLWTVEVERGGINGLYFDKGWSQFYQENSLEARDLVVFEHKDGDLFDFKLFGSDGYEKKGVGCPKFRVKEEAEEIIAEEEEEEEEEKEEEEDDDDDDEDDDDYVVDESDYEEVELVCMSPKNKSKSNKASFCASPKKRFKDEEEIDIEDGEDEIEILNLKYNKASSSYNSSLKERVKEEEIEGKDKDDEIQMAMKVSKSRPSSSKHKKHDINDYYGHDIFRSGLAIRPKNPYFVSRSRKTRKNELHIPNEVIEGWNLKIPARMLVMDGSGNRWESTVKKWRDGRVWCTRGWRRMCSANNIGTHDTCICEFVQQASHALYMLVHVVRRRI